jgi:hypothetical protein
MLGLKNQAPSPDLLQNIWVRGGSQINNLKNTILIPIE